MYYRYTIVICILFIAVTGCDRLSDVFPTASPEPTTLTPPVSMIPEQTVSAPKTVAVDPRYEQAVRRRIELQEKILEAMDLYRTVSQRVYMGSEQLKQLAGGKPLPEVIELFSRHQNIPTDLLVAHARWRTLMPDERLLLRIDTWLMLEQVKGNLVAYEVYIYDYENNQRWGRISNQTPEEIYRIDQLNAQMLIDWEKAAFDEARLYEQIIETQKIRFTR